MADLDILDCFNEGNVPTAPQFMSLWKMNLGVPVKVMKMRNHEAPKGPCLECVYEDASKMLYKTYFEDELKLFPTDDKCKLMLDSYEKGSPVYLVPYAVRSNRSVFFVKHCMYDLQLSLSR